jgi:hypothetical protein
VLRWPLAAAAQPLQQRDRAAGRLVHVELAEPRQLDDFRGGHRADHRVALQAACLQRGQHRQEVLLHEQHRGDHDVALRDVGLAAFERGRVVRPLRSGVQRQRQAGDVILQSGARAIRRVRQMGVHRDDDDPDGGRFSGRSALSRHTVFPR